jgi:Uma2 family endonuclease
MVKAVTQAQILPLTVRLLPVVNLTDDQLYEFCQINSELRIERTAEGDLLIMPPAVWETSHQNSEVNLQLGVWAKQDNTGLVSDSSGGFLLPNGAMRSPDAAWVRRSRLSGLSRAQRQKFLPLCPDFVIELRSPSDSLRSLQAKMEEYIENGAQLGWLLDSQRRRVYVYRPQRQVETLEDPATLAGDPELPGFTLDMREIWKEEL